MGSTTPILISRFVTPGLENVWQRRCESSIQFDGPGVFAYRISAILRVHLPPRIIIAALLS